MKIPFGALAAMALATGLALGQGATYLDALVLLSEAASSPEEIGEALSRLESVRGDFGNVARYHLALAALHLKKGDAAAAEAAMLAAIEAEPKFASGYVALAQLRERRGDLDGAERALTEAVSLSSQSSTARMLLADLALRRKDLEAAKLFLREITNDAPNAIPAWRRLGEIALEQRDYETADDAARRVLARLPSDLSALLLEGRVLVARGRAQEAVAKLEAVVADHSQEAPAHFELGKAYLAAGEIDIGRQSLSRATTLVPSAPGPYLVLAESYIRTRELALAVGTLDQVPAQANVQRERLRLLGTAFLEGKDFDRAIDAWGTYSDIANQDPLGPYSIARALAAMGNPGEAEQYLEKSLERGPAFAPALVELASLHVRKNQRPVALARVEKQVAIEPDSAPLHRLLGDLRRDSGDRVKAEASYRRSLELDPSVPETYLSLGALLFAQARDEEATALIAEALSKWPGDVRPMLMLGSSFQQKGDLAAARTTYEKARELAPGSPVIANNLAWVYLELGDREQALELATRAHELAPETPDIADTLAWVYYTNGSYLAARTLLSRAVEALPTNAEVHYHMGMTLFRLRESKEAARYLERSLALALDEKLADEARRTLAAIRAGS